MLTSIATVSLSGTLETKLRAVSNAGFEGVEIFESDLLAYPGTASEVRRLIGDLGLTCTLFQPFRDFEGFQGDLRQRAFDRAEQKFDVMQELGAGLLLVCSSVAREALPDRERIIDDFRELGERALRRGLKVGYEGLAWGRHINDHRQVWNIVRAVDHSAVGIILDSFHSLVRQIPIGSIREIDPEKIFLVQLADAPWLDMDYLYWSRHFRNMPGQGDIPVRAFVSALLEIGYSGPLSLEIFNDRFRAMPASVVAQDGIRSLKLSIDEGARAVGLQSPLHMPPRVACAGFDFIEFAATESEAEDISLMLRSLGFELAGKHRSKPAMWWRQGSVNLVINADPEGFAFSHNVAHGPSVCAICLRIGDVGGAVNRAKELAIPSFEGRVGRGEMKIPAIRDPGGALIYLVDDHAALDHWQRDFDAVETNADRADTLIGAVDHIAYAVSDQEIFSWVEFYFALFEVKKPPAVEFVDPLGLVQSQPIESPDRRLRLLFNGSSGSQTLAARLHDRYWGAGVQYISVATTDIFATARRLAVLGFERLEIPANYDEELAARFGLDRAMVGEMAAHGILYDRDDQGEYFQLSSRAFRKRFFFEFVERRRYDGYGVANETIRLATQSRFKAAAIAADAV